MRTLRNVGIIAHVDAGKTTMTERLLQASSAIHRAGSVDSGSTVTDFDPQEKAKGITIQAATVHFPWKGFGVNLIDTPGHADFTIEVERSLRVLDGAVVLLDAVAGVQPQTEKVWRQADRHRVPRIAFVNKVDKPGSDLDRVLETMRARLGAQPVLVAYPVSTEGGWVWVDLLEGRFDDLPEAERSRANRLRESLVTACAEFSSEVEEAFLEERSVPRALLEEAIRSGLQLGPSGRFVPVWAGSAARSVGVEALLDAITHYLPAPTPVEGGLQAFCFKVSFLEHGPMSFVRVYAGQLRKGDKVWRSGVTHPIRAGRLVRVFGGQLEDVDALDAGEIGAVLGGHLRTGDSLAAEPGKPPLDGFQTPDPVMHLALEPVQPSERERWSAHLERMLLEDPSLVRTVDAETGEQILGGLGELHLEVSLEKLRQRTGLRIGAGAPKVALRSVLLERRKARYRHSKQHGGHGQFADVTLTLEPEHALESVEIVNATRGGVIPAEYFSGVEKGIREALARGPLGGWPLVGVRVRVEDGMTHSEDSSELSFKIAAQAAVEEALREAPLALLEPVMGLELVLPAEALGRVIGDLQRRRGVVQSVEEGALQAEIAARVPLAELFGYASRLASLTQGRASWSSSPLGFERAPEAAFRQLLRRAG